jgi:hypothetical protein
MVSWLLGGKVIDIKYNDRLLVLAIGSRVVGDMDVLRLN